jgi:hypothetical protein
MPDDLIAWAAGLYDGEGSASMDLPRLRNTPRRQMQVSQGGIPGILPAVLVRFREIVGDGNITGPYGGDLYYWKTTRKDAIDEIARTLWPYLSHDKRAQFTAMTAKARRAFIVDERAARGVATERPWAAGLFDGEGSVWIAKNAHYPAWRGLAMELPQSTDLGVIPEALQRFGAIVGVGSISGPRMQRNSWSRKPQYRWQTSGRHSVSTVVRALWPWLGTVNRTRLYTVRALLDDDVVALMESASV